MKTAFKVEHIIIADYISEDSHGKGLFAGVYGNEIIYSTEPTVWNQFWVNVALSPLQADTNVYFDFVDPSGNSLIRLSGTMRVSGDVGEFARVNVIFQIPQLPFSGAGIYSFKVGEIGKKPNFVKRLNVAVGAASGSVPVELKMNAEFMGAKLK